MIYDLIIQTEAILEIRKAFDWYEEQKADLGYEFLSEVEACYKKICVHPGHYSYVNELYRRIKTNRFPYVLIYEIEDNQVIINSVRHVKRKPL